MEIANQQVIADVEIFFWLQFAMGTQTDFAFFFSVYSSTPNVSVISTREQKKLNKNVTLLCR